ncbi:sensor histidine kinase [Tenacibaculum sp. MAR_2009_124]|uniref:sensor histidine kinase n=1 Tax=Tenacibaculum sp. MAR_2009_124 TaxID=1250059 RepID=UPI00210195F3|nr:histidine kinase [Tenacibaculum sp. MAR_2009_124]
MLFRYTERTQEIDTIKQERTALELKLLKSQINPHILLNNLNTIYSFSLEKPDETPNLILKLAENLKHVLYESNAEKVPLSNEIKFIDNYIEFQKLRTEGIKTINYTQSISDTNYKVAPLLLITLIENTFKHSLIGSLIDIEINVVNDFLYCICNNNYDPDKQVSKTSIGLKNLQKRLDLIYKEKYELKIDNEEFFNVALKLNLL